MKNCYKSQAIHDEVKGENIFFQSLTDARFGVQSLATTWYRSHDLNNGADDAGSTEINVQIYPGPELLGPHRLGPEVQYKDVGETKSIESGRDCRPFFGAREVYMGLTTVSL